jgi:hypothetical protein
MAKSKKSAASSPADGKRGVIDQFEGDLATIVFDDNEQLVVARRTLPPEARVGDVVTVRLPDTKIASASTQALPATPSIEIQAEDTTASQKRVRDLLDDIFKQ